MGSFFKHLKQGLSIMGILTVQLPMVLMDGKITIDEMATLFKSVCEAADWKIEISLPSGIEDTVLGMTEIADE